MKTRGDQVGIVETYASLLRGLTTTIAATVSGSDGVTMRGQYKGVHVQMTTQRKANFIATVSSVTPSPLAPKSYKITQLASSISRREGEHTLTLRKTWYPPGLLLNGALPWCWICSIQNGALGAAVPLVTGAEHCDPRPETSAPSPRSVRRCRNSVAGDIRFILADGEKSGRNEESSWLPRHLNPPRFLYATKLGWAGLFGSSPTMDDNTADGA